MKEEEEEVKEEKVKEEEEVKEEVKEEELLRETGGLGRVESPTRARSEVGATMRGSRRQRPSCPGGATRRLSPRPCLPDLRPASTLTSCCGEHEAYYCSSRLNSDANEDNLSYIYTLEKLVKGFFLFVFWYLLISVTVFLPYLKYIHILKNRLQLI